MDVNEIEVGKVYLTEAPRKTHFTKYKLHDRPIFGAFSAGEAGAAAHV